MLKIKIPVFENMKVFFYFRVCSENGLSIHSDSPVSSSLGFKTKLSHRVQLASGDDIILPTQMFIKILNHRIMAHTVKCCTYYMYAPCLSSLVPWQTRYI